MRNHEVIKAQNLLNAKGNIAEPGYAKSLIWKYSRNQIKAPKFRIKEWDLGYIGMQSVSLLNFKEGWEHTESIVNPLPMGKMELPNTSVRGNTKYKDKRLNIEFKVKEGKRMILCNFKKFHEGKDFSCKIVLDEPKMDSMVIATPFKKDKHFYYNQKINCMPASGTASFNGKTYTFNKETDFGTLDWGRGVWTYDNTWYWGSGNTIVNGKPFGFNIGYGFGDTKAATENMLFYDGVAHKLDDVKFHIPKGDYMKPWKFSSSDGRFEMDFVPVLDRAALTDLKVIVSDQHQVFGKMTGKAVLDDGTVIEVKDMMCFAEDVHNKY